MDQLNELKEVHKAKMGDEDKWRVFAYDKGKSSHCAHANMWTTDVHPCILVLSTIVYPSC